MPAATTKEALVSHFEAVWNCDRINCLPHPLATSPNLLTVAVGTRSAAQTQLMGKEKAMRSIFGGRYLETTRVEKRGGARIALLVRGLSRIRGIVTINRDVEEK